MKTHAFFRQRKRNIRRAACLGLAAGVSLLALGVFSGKAETNERRLRFFHVDTGEHLDIVYKRNGVYIPDALAAINRQLRDWRLNQTTTMDPKLLDLVWEVYQASGSTGEIHVICGYRAPPTNAMLHARSNLVAENSQHMGGKALDFALPDVPLAKLRELGLRVQFGGVGFYPTSRIPFVHMDTGSVRMWPRMSRDQLAKVFPDGKTIYIPADGKPLPGYQEALAEYKARGSIASVASLPSPTAGTRTLLATLFGKGADGAKPAMAAPVATAAPVGVPPAAGAPVRLAAADAAPVPLAKPAPALRSPASDPRPMVRTPGPAGAVPEGAAAQPAIAAAVAPVEARPITMAYADSAKVVGKDPLRLLSVTPWRRFRLPAWPRRRRKAPMRSV